MDKIEARWGGFFGEDFPSYIDPSTIHSSYKSNGVADKAYMRRKKLGSLMVIKLKI